MPDKYDQNTIHLWIGISPRVKEYNNFNQQLYDIIFKDDYHGHKFIQNLKEYLIQNINFLDNGPPMGDDHFMRKVEGFAYKSSQLKFNTNNHPGHYNWLPKDSDDRWASKYIWGFHKDGIELINGWGKNKRKDWYEEEFTHDELKIIGESIKKYLKVEYGIPTIVKIRKRPKM